MPLRNPNATQNRVPDARELATLRSIAKSKEELAESIKTRITEAGATYEGAMERYRAQKLVLDSLLSEVHTAEQFLGVLETQKKILDDEMHGLRGLIHPIRRCPPEVLSNIFAMTITPVLERAYYSSYRWPLIQAYDILSVCRYWRDVALHCPQLWAVIPICLDDGLKKVRACWKRSVDRVKHASASICLAIRDSDHSQNVHRRRQHLRDAFSICDLRRIPNISILRLEGGSSIEATQALSLMTHFPTGSLGRFEIAGYWGTEAEPLGWWSWTAFLQRFPPFTSLELNGVQNFTIHEGTTFPAVKRLNLADHHGCRLPELLVACPNLEYLDLDAMFETMVSSDCQIPSLEELVVHTISDFPWSWLKTPNLTSFCFTNGSCDDDMDDDCGSFLSEAQHLTSVELRMPEGSFMKVARATDTLLHLTLELHEVTLELFLRWEEAGLTGPPFTKLKTLSLYYSEQELENEVPALLYFDELVSKRCLPLSNPESRLVAPLNPLETLFIKQHPALPSTWMNSIHCKTATAQIVKRRKHFSSVTLSWVVNEDDLWDE
jgi:F-box-like